jgi:large subunit ribosomal protein L23
MALFGLKTKSTTTERGAEKAAEIAKELVQSAGAPGFAHILRNPRITEKASLAMEGFAYVFDVAETANKKEIAAAVRAIYGVTPRKVATVNVKPKEVRNMRTGKKGIKGGYKKAYVYLQKGETITIV